MAVQISGNDITVPRDTTVTRNLTVGGVLTYEDVTNVDSVGLVTARSGIEIGARPGVGASISVDGNAIFSGITTATTLRSTTGIVTTLTATGLTVDSGTTNTCATFKSSDAGAVINLTDNSARSSIEQSGADLKIISDTDAGDADSTIKFQVDSSTKAIIDHSGRLLLGTTTEGEASADNLTIADSGNCGITIRSGSSNAGGIYFSDGTSGSAEYRGLIAYNQSSDYLQIFTSASERLRIDTDGRVMIGQTSSVVPFMITATASGFGGENTVGVFGDGTSYAAGVGGGLTLSGRYNSSDSQVGYAAIRGRKENGTDGNYDGALTFATRPNGGNMTERARITSGGKFNIGDTANTGYALMVKTTGTATAMARFENTGGAADGTEISIYHNTASPADGDQTGYLQFTGNDSSGNGTIYNAIIGYTTDVTDGQEDGDLRFFCRDNATFSQKLNIASDGTFTGSSSNDISDQRLKDNIATVVDPITKIKALKGRTFTWKPEAKLPAGTKYGFIAQEVETVVSDLVDDKHGIRQFDKDGNLIPEDENGKINTDEGTTDSKSVNAIGVVPILVEALKEALVKIETLETRLNNAGIAT